MDKETYKVYLPVYFYDLYFEVRQRKEEIEPCIIRNLKNFAFIKSMSSQQGAITVIKQRRYEHEIQLGNINYTLSECPITLKLNPVFQDIYLGLGFDIENVSQTIVASFYAAKKVKQYLYRNNKVLSVKDNDQIFKVHLL